MSATNDEENDQNAFSKNEVKDAESFPKPLFAKVGQTLKYRAQSPGSEDEKNQEKERNERTSPSEMSSFESQVASSPQTPGKAQFLHSEMATPRRKIPNSNDENHFLHNEWKKSPSNTHQSSPTVESPPEKRQNDKFLQNKSPIYPWQVMNSQGRNPNDGAYHEEFYQSESSEEIFPLYVPGTTSSPDTEDKFPVSTKRLQNENYNGWESSESLSTLKTSKNQVTLSPKTSPKNQHYNPTESSTFFQEPKDTNSPKKLKNIPPRRDSKTPWKKSIQNPPKENTASKLRKSCHFAKSEEPRRTLFKK